MGRSTNGKVVTTNVSTSKIREIFNTDKASKPISQTGRKASDFFTDGDVDNSINDNFIDVEYCPVDDGEGATKKDRFIRNPKSWGHWRNYGGEEVDEGTGYPYIYWKNVIDQSSIEHIDNTILETYSIVPTVTIFPNKTSADTNLNNNVVNSKNLASSYQSTMFSGNKLIDSIIATKVGIDYGIFTDGIFSSEVYTGAVPNFSIKVTPRIIDSNAPLIYVKQYTENGEIVTKEYDAGASITGAFALPIIFQQLSALLVTLGPSNPQFWTQLWNWFSGPNSPLTTLIQWPGWSKISTWLSNKLLSGPLVDSLGSAWAYLGPILAELAIIAGIVITIDMIWDLTNPEAEITDALYQYAETVSGNYVFQDINRSNYKFSFGNKSIMATGTSNGYFTKEITLGGYSHSYTLEDYNFDGTSFSSDNLISEFPTNDSVRSKYLNMDFLAQLQQFDLQVPPPILEYKVELVPINNCTLHPNKTSAFVVRIAPEKYLTPNFSINTSMNNSGKRELYWNSSISFNNARYADFIYLKDTERNSAYWFNLFGDYNNVAINTAINETSGNTNPSVVLQDYGGNNLVTTGSQLFYVPHTQTDSIPVSEYEVYFMREASPNVLFNPYFRTEQDENNLLLTTLRSFWDHSLDITVGKGVAVKNDEVAATTYLQQSISRLIPSNNSAKSYYILQIGINKSAGNIYLNTSNNFQTMTYLYQLCPDDGFLTDNFDRVPIDGGYGDKVNYFSTYAGDYGISYSTDKIEFLNSGNYFIVLEVVNTPEKILKFEFSSDFSGYITHCKLQNLPRQIVGTSGRNATNMLTESNQITPKFTWMSDWVSTKLFTLYFDTSNPYSTNVTVNLELLKYLSNKDVFGGQKVLTTVERVNVKYIFDNNTGRNVVDDDDYYMSAEEDYTGQSIENETLALTYDGDIPLARMEITLYIRKSNYNTNLQQIVSLESGSIALVALKDFNDCLLDSDITLHNTSLGQSYGSLEWDFSYIPTRLNSLDISNNVSIKDNVENITYIDNTFKAANTGITGDLSSIISIPNLYLNGVYNLTYYGIGEPQYEDPNTEPHIEWKSSNIQVEYLNNLVKAMTLSGMYNGYLDIKGSNPKITDVTTLANIDILVDRGWTVLYNTVEEWTYEGVLTVGENLTASEYPIYGYGAPYYDDTNFGNLSPLQNNIQLIIWTENFLEIVLYEPMDITNIKIEDTIYSSINADNSKTNYYIENISNPFSEIGATINLYMNYLLPVKYNFDGYIYPVIYNPSYNDNISLISELGSGYVRMWDSEPLGHINPELDWLDYPSSNNGWPSNIVSYMTGELIICSGNNDNIFPYAKMICQLNNDYFLMSGTTRRVGGRNSNYTSNIFENNGTFNLKFNYTDEHLVKYGYSNIENYGSIDSNNFITEFVFDYLHSLSYIKMLNFDTTCIVTKYMINSYDVESIIDNDTLLIGGHPDSYTLTPIHLQLTWYKF